MSRIAVPIRGGIGLGLGLESVAFARAVGGDGIEMGSRGMGHQVLSSAWVRDGPTGPGTRLLRRYWSVPERQIETSVVLAEKAWLNRS